MRLLIFALLVVPLLLLSTSPAFARDQIRIVGSSTVYPFSTIVAERHGQSSQFKTPVIESTGTGSGFKLFCSGVGERHPDIVNASRKMKSSEWKLCQKNGVKEVVELVIGNDGIALANSVQAQQPDFTLQQLWIALAEKGPRPERWSEIDPKLPNTKIQVMVPPPTSGTRDAWNALVMQAGCSAEVRKARKEDCALLREDGAAIEAGENDTLIVQKLAANPGAFGIFGFSYLENNVDKIHAARIEGVLPSIDSIQSAEYPISRPLYVYVKKAHVGVIPGIREFVQEYASSAAIGMHGYLSDIGLVPLPASHFSSVRKVALQLTPMIFGAS